MKINFFTNISHELRTPLTLIYGPVNMLPGIQDKKRLHELINLINDNIQRLLKLVDQTLSLSRIENDTLPLSVCRQDILPVVERMMAGFACYAREKRIDISLTATPPGRMTVAVDTDKFSKILSNLVSNALKYTPEEGHIEVSLTLADTLPEKLTAAASSHYLVVSVTDDGAGMSQEDVEHIFERYKRLTANEHVAAGSGIGLHYVKQLLLIHKGSIVAEVRHEGGMCFTFAIPVDESLYDIAGEPTVEVEFIDGMATAVVDTAGQPPRRGGGCARYGSAAENGHRRGQPAAAALLPPDIRSPVRRFHGGQRLRRIRPDPHRDAGRSGHRRADVEDGRVRTVP